MKRLFVILAVLFASAVAGLWFHEQSGYVQIAVGQTTLETSLFFAAASLAVLILGLFLLVGLLRRVRSIAGVKHVYIASGIRFDLLAHQPEYRRELLHHHIGGLLKVAPEALSPTLLSHMRKPAPELFEVFLHAFYATQRKLGRRCSVVPYLMAGHPGSTLEDMLKTALFLRRNRMQVEQVQEFTPTPGTLATCMYYTGIDPLRGEKITVRRDPHERRLQKALLLAHQPAQHQMVREALRRLSREELFHQVTGTEESGKSQTSAKGRPPKRKKGKGRNPRR